MTWFDIAVLLVLGVSVLLGVMRGFVKEALSVVSWLCAGLLARQFAPAAAAFLPASVNPEPLRLAAGFILVGVFVLLVFWIVGSLLSELVKVTGLSAANRLLGAALGVIRGTLVVVAAVLVAGLTALPRESQWRNAWLSPLFEQLAMATAAWLPETIRANIRYDGK